MTESMLDRVAEQVGSGGDEAYWRRVEKRILRLPRLWEMSLQEYREAVSEVTGCGWPR